MRGYQGFDHVHGPNMDTQPNLFVLKDYSYWPSE
jgi:hypothetical protein